MDTINIILMAFLCVLIGFHIGKSAGQAASMRMVKHFITETSKIAKNTQETEYNKRKDFLQTLMEMSAKNVKNQDKNQ